MSSPAIQKLLEKIRAERAQTPIQEVTSPKESLYSSVDKYGNQITLNTNQSEAVRRAAAGESIVLIGAAGTGKTTTQKAVCQELVLGGSVGVLNAGDHKHLTSGTPGILIVAFTRRAIANIKRNVSEDMKANCVTVHKALEYAPHYFEVFDDKSGEYKTTMRFEESRNAENPLPSSIRTVIVEEASMLGVDLYLKLKRALPHEVQWIFLGDIQQLRPVFGPAILGFKLLQYPVIELKEVYRQALESPIIRLAHRILSGNPIPAPELSSWNSPGLTIKPWKKKIDAINALNTAALAFVGNKHKESVPSRQCDGLFSVGAYNPYEDIILIPFNESFGTLELNKKIAHHLAWHHKSEVWQIISGFQKHHLRVGEKVLYDKEDATVVSIERNPDYTGTPAMPASTTLDYWGHDPEYAAKVNKTDQEIDVDFMLSQVAMAKNEDRVHQASHKITLLMTDSDQEITLSKASELNSLLLGYALTVHKAQGSEFRRVFCIFHNSHATMILREMLYTAVTRAREELFIICEPDTFEKGIERQGIKGNTIEEKAEFFKGKIDAGFVFDE